MTCNTTCECATDLMCVPNVLCKTCGNICMAKDVVNRLIQYFNEGCIGTCSNWFQNFGVNNAGIQNSGPFGQFVAVPNNNKNK